MKLLRLAPTALALWMLLATTPAAALTLWEPQLQSTWGQPLDLRVDLSYTDGSSPRVSLAPAAEYRKRGLEPPSVLLGLEVEVEADSAFYQSVRVRSKRGIRDPILTLLLDVRQGHTRLIRQYTGLLDLPPAVAAAPGRPKPAELQPPRVLRIETGLGKLGAGPPVLLAPMTITWLRRQQSRP